MPQPHIHQDPAEGPRGPTSASADARPPSATPPAARAEADPAEGDRAAVERELRRQAARPGTGTAKRPGQ